LIRLPLRHLDALTVAGGPGLGQIGRPALDMGFVVLEPRGGENIEHVLGANTAISG
jgi:hypothetical protein